MSGFSDVDRSIEVDRLVRYLEKTDGSMSAMKAYAAAAAARTVPGGTVLDIGCGLGHDLERLHALGMRAIGLDASAEMLARARDRAAGLCVIRGDAGSLALRASSIDGCRVERVLQHVSDPCLAIGEIARILRPGGFVAALEPDYRTFRVASALCEDGSIPARLLVVRHPNVGGELPELLERAGFRVDDIVTESSRGYRFERLPIDAEAVVTRAAAEGRIEDRLATAWLAEQRDRTDAETFRACWDKVMVIARKL